jgi:hypothetical protein
MTPYKMETVGNRKEMRKRKKKSAIENREIEKHETAILK